MTDIDRRQFVNLTASGAATAALSAKLRAKTPFDRPLSRPEILRAMADAILPAELGPEGITAAVEQFEQWLENYHPGAELNHGYGTGDLEYLPPSPAPVWDTQLGMLDRWARQRFQMPFVDLGIPERRRIVSGAVGPNTPAGLPRPYNAPHVAIALLSFFLATPSASNLCYGRAIHKQACRPLSRTGEIPPATGTETL